MRLHALFIYRKGLEDQTPELIEAWDDFSVDNWFEGWEDAKAKALDAIGTDLLSSAVVEIDIPSGPIRAALMPRTVVVGHVVETS